MLRPRVTPARKRKRQRLWPLLFLPLIGLLGGWYLGRELTPLPLGVRALDPLSGALMGLLAGCGAMVTSASAVLAYRIAEQRFTIGAILTTIAVIAVLLGAARALLF
jgi:hypothetical protein